MNRYFHVAPMNESKLTLVHPLLVSVATTLPVIRKITSKHHDAQPRSNASTHEKLNPPPSHLADPVLVQIVVALRSRPDCFTGDNQPPLSRQNVFRIAHDGQVVEAPITG